MSNINHPDHYKGNTSIECIEAMSLIYGDDAVSVFCLVNAFKYIWRHEYKNGFEDLQKAEWYLSKAEDLGKGCDPHGWLKAKITDLRVLLDDKWDPSLEASQEGGE